MESLWQEEEAAQWEGELGKRVYTSRLLGTDPSLVLHGGGNTSVKIKTRSLLGVEEEILHIKGSGHDLATIEAAGFCPVRLSLLEGVLRLDFLSGPDMAELLATSVARSQAPRPSVETLLHAALPHKYIDHTHADAMLAISNTPDGMRRLQELYGDVAVVIPYAMPGLELARTAYRRFMAEGTKNTIGLVLAGHGLVSFGDSARESYERMIELVDRAERYLQERGAWSMPPPQVKMGDKRLRETLSLLRREISLAAGHPMLLARFGDDLSLSFAWRDVHRIARQGPVTPDHVLYTKRWPMLGRDVAAYTAEYRDYFQGHTARAREPKVMLDPAPRVVLDQGLGLCVAGRDTREVAVAADIYQHTMDIILCAEALGGYRAQESQDVFDVEYWDLEQAKLARPSQRPAFSGEVVLVTGAASGIGRACVEAFRRRGAAVVAVDLNAAVEDDNLMPDYKGFTVDVTDETAMREVLEQAVRAFGGIDMLVLNAGIFPAGCPIAQLKDKDWRKVMAVNLDASFFLMRECHPLLKLAPRGGRVVVIGSKNVPAPGPGAAAYSASKAALNQLARVAALEWGCDNIRINSLHPNAVFDTGIWTEEVLRDRAQRYGLTVAEYKTNNLLRTTVGSRDVAELAAELCGPLFAKTTGAQIPVDGGNDRVV